MNWRKQSKQAPTLDPSILLRYNCREGVDRAAHYLRVNTTENRNHGSLDGLWIGPNNVFCILRPLQSPYGSGKIRLSVLLPACFWACNPYGLGDASEALELACEKGMLKQLLVVTVAVGYVLVKPAGSDLESCQI
jgi:hypothetical protein